MNNVGLTQTLGERYVPDDMFKLSGEMNKMYHSISMLFGFYILKSRHYHVNKYIILNSISLGLIPKLSSNDSKKYNFYTQLK